MNQIKLRCSAEAADDGTNSPGKKRCDVGIRVFMEGGDSWSSGFRV